VVHRSSDQPTNTELPGSASQGPFSPQESPVRDRYGHDSVPVGEEGATPFDQGSGQPPPAVPVPLWPPPPAQPLPVSHWAPPVEGPPTSPPHNGAQLRGKPSLHGRPLDALGRPLASWAKRILALLVDFFFLSLLLSWFGHTVFPNLLSSSSAIYNKVPESQALSFLGVSFLVWVGYLTLLGSSKRGQTLGMMLYGIAVRGLDGGQVSVGRATVRSVILVVLSGFLIDAFWPLWDPRRQALHDKPARTVVVDMRLAALLQQLPQNDR
jgi:uncharacterized RDD family membrane protein YckC